MKDCEVKVSKEEKLHFGVGPTGMVDELYFSSNMTMSILGISVS